MNYENDETETYRKNITIKMCYENGGDQLLLAETKKTNDRFKISHNDFVAPPGDHLRGDLCQTLGTFLARRRFAIALFQTFFSRMRSEGSRFIWGSGGEAVFAESCVYVRNRPQPSATVRVSAVRLSTVASAPGVIPKACQVDSCRRSYTDVCSGGVCVSDLCRRSYIGVCRGGVCVSDLCRRSCIGVCRGGVSASDLCCRSYIAVCSGGVCVSDLCRRSYIGVCSGGVSASDLCCRSYIGVCSGGVCVSDLCRRSYIGVCSGGVCVSDLCRRSYIGVCRGGVCESDLWRRSCIGVCRGGV